MAQAVYSTRFANAALTSANTILYTVPTGYRALVLSMTLGWVTLARVAGNSIVLDRNASAIIWSVDHAASARASAVWNGRWVLYETDTIRASTTATGTIWLTVSGQLLTLP